MKDVSPPQGVASDTIPFGLLNMQLSLKASKLRPGDVHSSGILRRLQADGFDTDVQLPFTHHDLSCWLRKSDASGMGVDDLMTAIKVCAVETCQVSRTARACFDNLEWQSVLR